jgi:hypothetical protein
VEEGPAVELMTVLLVDNDRAAAVNAFVIIAEVLVWWLGDEIGGRSEFVGSSGGWDETAGALG